MFSQLLTCDSVPSEYSVLTTPYEFCIALHRMPESLAINWESPATAV